MASYDEPRIFLSGGPLRPGGEVIRHVSTFSIPLAEPDETDEPLEPEDAGPASEGLPAEWFPERSHRTVSHD
jgi:hypothetical protein